LARPITHDPSEVVSGLADGRPRASDSRGIVLMMLFLALGPLALPMLWRSRGFSPLWKTLLTVIVTGATLALLFVIWFVIAKAIEPLSQLKSLEGF
jgi:CHASE2 domain-containing sensor protein